MLCQDSKRQNHNNYDVLLDLEIFLGKFINQQLTRISVFVAFVTSIGNCNESLLSCHKIQS